MPAQSTPNCTCEVCGATFHRKQSQIVKYGGRFCSNACRYAAPHPRTPHKTNRQVARTCETCGATFTRFPSVIAKGQGRFCSSACWYKHLSTIRGADKWTWVGDDVTCTCEQCGKAFTVRPSRVRKRYADGHVEERRFCSRVCKGVWHRAHYFGENNKNWRGGHRDARVNEHNRAIYKEWRRAVFHRDNYTCRKCGKRGGRLNAHHIRPWASYADLRFDVGNGATYCKACHIDIHRKMSRPTEERLIRYEQTSLL